MSATGIVILVTAIISSLAGGKAAGDWLSELQERRRQDDRDHDVVYGFTDGHGTRHPGVAERLDLLEPRVAALEGTAAQ